MINRQFEQRAPRIGIDPDILKKLAVNLNNFKCEIISSDEKIHTTKIIALINISIGGLKIAVADYDVFPEVKESIEMTFILSEKRYLLRGRIAWCEKITGGNIWLGIDLKHNQISIETYRLLNGEDSV